uniref:Uncharacterized protein n=1 Tax=Lepeophtheirus salmonis TaxID=72036 RepID=A0A0K2V220_LEPSM
MNFLNVDFDPPQSRVLTPGTCCSRATICRSSRESALSSAIVSSLFPTEHGQGHALARADKYPWSLKSTGTKFLSILRLPVKESSSEFECGRGGTSSTVDGSISSSDVDLLRRRRR